MLKCKGFEIERKTWGCGERHVKVSKANIAYGKNLVIWNWEDGESHAELFEILLINDALKRAGWALHELVIPYIPYGRQDRVTEYGEAHSLKVFADVINPLNLLNVKTYDPHSHVTDTLINNLTIVEQYEIFGPMLQNKGNVCLIAPDLGASKKIEKFSNKFPVVQCLKKRTNDGIIIDILGDEYNRLEVMDRDCYIVDDICDGGRTFIEVAKLIKRYNPKSLNLMVTHGFFTNGFGELNKHFDKIYTRKGEVQWR
jgi:ribose-phosphate pyrophosphokinase